MPALALAAPPRRKADPKKQAAEQAARGDAWAVASRCDEAVKAYRQSLTLQPKNPVVQVRLAHCLAKTGGAAEAKQILAGLADEAGTTGLLALQELGDLALQSGDFAGAVDAYDKLLAKAPTNIDARMALLDALKGLSDAGDDKARARGMELAKKLKTEPKADTGQQRHAEELVAMFQYGDAAKDLTDGKRMLSMGDPKGAVVALERAVGKHADLEEAQYLLGLAYANPEVGKKDDARKAWQKAPHVKEAALALGVDAYEGGDLDEAVKRLKGAAALDAVVSGGLLPARPRLQGAGRDGGGARRVAEGGAHRSEERARQVGVDEAAGADRQRELVRRGAGDRFGVGDRHRPGDRQAGDRALGPA